MDKVKKILKLSGIVLGVVVVLIVIAAIALPRFLPLDKIKDIAAEKASEAVHRNVKIGHVSFNIFTGIEIRDVSVSNRPGFSKEPFISAGLIEMKYDLWKLLRGKVAINKIVLVKPEILIENMDGVSNYSDMVGAKKPAQPKKPQVKKEPISILVSSFAIKDAKLTMNTFTKGVKKVMQLKDLNLSMSGISLKTIRPMSFYVGMTGVYEGKDVPITVSGRINLDLGKSYVKVYDMDITAAGEKLSLMAEVTRFDKAPVINMDVSSRKIDTDKFLAILTGTGTKKPKVKVQLPYGQQTATINRSLKSVPANIKLKANVNLNNILFKEMKVDSVAAGISMAGKVMNIRIDGIEAYKGIIKGNVTADLNVSGVGYTLTDIAGKGFDAKPASNDVLESFLTKLPDYKELKDKMSGALSFRISLAGRGVETPDIIANAKGKGSFLLANGKITKIKSLAAIGEKIGISTLSNDIDIKEFGGDFSIANKIVKISGLKLNNGDSGDIKLTFNGSANISTLAFIGGNRLSLKLNPKTTKLASEYDPFKDEAGWYSLDFEMTGALKKPIPIPQLGRPLQQMMENKKKEVEGAAQKEIDKQKKAAEEAAQKEIDKKKQEAEDKAKQELENKAKELLKF